MNAAPRLSYTPLIFSFVRTGFEERFVVTPAIEVDLIGVTSNELVN